MDSIIVSLHVIVGAVLFMFSGIMQLVVGPAVKLLPESEHKAVALKQLQGRAQPAMGIAIVLQILTAGHLVHSRWDTIVNVPWMSVKAAFGTLALTLAAILHFYIRYRKKSLAKNGRKEDAAKLSKTAFIMEKIVLISAVTTFIMGVLFNHY
jgi:hypothetical protein